MNKIYQKMYPKKKNPAKSVLGGFMHNDILRSFYSEFQFFENIKRTGYRVKTSRHDGILNKRLEWRVKKPWHEDNINNVILMSRNSGSRLCFAKRVGFTLIELLVVMLIIGILAAIALPYYQKAVERARAAEAMTNLRALVTSEKLYQMANNSATEDLSLLDIQLAGETNGNGEMILPNFTYYVRIAANTQEGFEAVATRNNDGNDLTAYYLYYNYDGNYSCVAKTVEAKVICSAFCASGMVEHSVPGTYVCGIR